MPSTGKGFPYPSPSDPVAQGAAAIQDLAEFIDDNTGRSSGGAVTITMTSQIQKNVTVTFPTGRFAAVPYVVANAGVYPLVCAVNAITATNFNLLLFTSDGSHSSDSTTVHWVAQGSPG